jgi:hypothetical protein
MALWIGCVTNPLLSNDKSILLRLSVSCRRCIRARGEKWNSPLCQISRTLYCLRMELISVIRKLFVHGRRECCDKVTGVTSPTCASPEMGNGFTSICKSQDAVFLRVKLMFFVHGAVSAFK